MGLSGRRGASWIISEYSSAQGRLFPLRVRITGWCEVTGREVTGREVRGREVRRVLWIALIVVPVFAQDPRIAHGEKVFSTSCSVPYCHGPNGTAGRAPKLAGHGFTASALTNTVSNGIANKGMPAFKAQLSAEDLDAVIGYVMSLRGNATVENPTAGRVNVAPSPGKALFFDATRMGGCSRCHELEKRGSVVAPEIKNVAADLRSVESAHIVTVSAAGETPFPGLVSEQSEKRVRVYDLSSQLPVLRTFAPNAIQMTPGSTWKHRDAVAGYSDAELRQIAVYLKEPRP
jgi:cytochrome c553